MLFNRFFPEVGQQDRPEPTLYHVFWLLILIWVIALPIGYFGQFVVRLYPVQQDWILLVSYLLQFGFALWIAMVWWQLSDFAISKVNSLIYVLLIPSIMAISVIVEGLASLIPMPEKIAELLANMVSFNLPGYITIGIFAPILEELIFRGVILRGLLNRYNPKKAIIWSAVVFGIAHLNPWQFIAAFIIGLFMGWIYYKTKSIFPGIFIHWFNNSLSFALGAYFSDMNATFYDLSGSLTNYIILILVSITVGGLSLWGLKRMLASKPEIV